MTRREPCTHIQSSGMLPWKPQRSPNKSSHISASLQQSALLIQLQKSSCLFFAVCSHLSAPQCRFWLPLKPILWSQSWMVHMALGRNILEFFPPVPSSAAQPGHSICFTLQWPFFPCSFMLQNKFLLQDRHFSSLKCSICSWPEPMGPTPSAGLNQPKTRLKQVRKIRLHPQNLTFTSGLVHITWCLQFSRKLSLYYKLVIYFRGTRRSFFPDIPSPAALCSWFTVSTIPWQTFTIRQQIMGVGELEVNPPQGAAHLLTSMKLTNKVSRLLLKRFFCVRDFLYNPQSQGTEKTHFSN